MSGEDMEKKVAVLERRVDDLHAWMRDLKTAIQDSGKSNADAIKELTKVVAELAGVVAELAGMKSDHERHSNEINALRRRQHEIGNEFGRVSIMEVKVEQIKSDVGVFRAFREDVLRTLPNMQLASGWVFKASLFIMAGLGGVALLVILKGAAA